MSVGSDPNSGRSNADPSVRRPADGDRGPTSSVQKKPKRYAVEIPEVFGRYRVVRCIGKGGMGTVYLATDTQLNRQVALKIPHFSADGSTEILKRFYREARAAANFDHPNLCSVHDVGEVNGIHYLTMTYIEGKSLSDFIPQGKGISAKLAAALTRKIALALSEAHKRGVIHRDLKPSNILINHRREPVVMDFGLAWHDGDSDSRITKSGAIIGTPAYMAPEQVEANSSVIGPCTDVYSLGVLLYQMLCGRPPYEGPVGVVLGQILHVTPDPPSKYRPDLDSDIQAICMKAMAKKISDRYPSMIEFADQLLQYVRASTEPGAVSSSNLRPISSAERPTLSPPSTPNPANGATASGSSQRPVIQQVAQPLRASAAPAVPSASPVQAAIPVARPVSPIPSPQQNFDPPHGVAVARPIGAAPVPMPIPAAAPPSPAPVPMTAPSPVRRIQARVDESADDDWGDDEPAPPPKKKLGRKAVLIAVAVALNLFMILAVLTDGGSESEPAGSNRANANEPSVANDLPRRDVQPSIPVRREPANNNDSALTTEPAPAEPPKPAEPVVASATTPTTKQEPAVDYPSGQATYEVWLDPPEAKLTATGADIAVSGAGKKRKILVKNADGRRVVTITATLDGFQTLERQLTPLPGSNDSVRIQLSAGGASSSSVAPSAPSHSVASLTPSQPTPTLSASSTPVNPLSSPTTPAANPSSPDPSVSAPAAPPSVAPPASASAPPTVAKSTVKGASAAVMSPATQAAVDGLLNATWDLAPKKAAAEIQKLRVAAMKESDVDKNVVQYATSLALLHHGQWDQALDGLRRITADDDEFLPAWLAIAYAFAQDGDAANVVETAWRAMKADETAGMTIDTVASVVTFLNRQPSKRVKASRVTLLEKEITEHLNADGKARYAAVQTEAEKYVQDMPNHRKKMAATLDAERAKATKMKADMDNWDKTIASQQQQWTRLAQQAQSAQRSAQQVASRYAPQIALANQQLNRNLVAQLELQRDSELQRYQNQYNNLDQQARQLKEQMDGLSNSKKELKEEYDELSKKLERADARIDRILSSPPVPFNPLTERDRLLQHKTFAEFYSSPSKLVPVFDINSQN